MPKEEKRKKIRREKEGESKVEDGEMKLLHNMDSHTSELQRNGLETAAAALCDKLRIPPSRLLRAPSAWLAMLHATWTILFAVHGSRTPEERASLDAIRRHGFVLL